MRSCRVSENADDIGDPNIGGWDKNRACLIEATEVEHIKITGPGHIDGNRAVLDNQRYYKGMARFTHCHDLFIDGPIFSDACGWNCTPRASTNVSITNFKIMNNRPIIDCINTDGCNPDGCQQVLIQNCMFHTGDDAVAVKSTNYGSEPTDVADVTVRDLIAVNNSTTAKIGTETMASKMERIHFERICAVRTRRLVAIDAYDFAAISDVSWTDCHVHHIPGNWKDPLCH